MRPASHVVGAAARARRTQRVPQRTLSVCVPRSASQAPGQGGDTRDAPFAIRDPPLGDAAGVPRRVTELRGMREPTKEMLQVLDKQQTSSPERLWALYLEALQERPVADAEGHLHVPPRLGAAHHRQMLYALVPRTAAYSAFARERASIRRQRAAARSEPATEPLDLSTPQEAGPPAARMSAAEATAYAEQVRLVLSNILRGAQEAGAPDAGVSTYDYNQALSVLAQDGHFAAMLTLWRDMQGASARTSAAANGEAAAPPAPLSSPAPDRWTYHHMMLGLFRHFERQMDSLRAAHGHKLLPTEFGRRRTLETAAPGDPRRQVLAAAQLASRRASALIQELQQQGMVPSVLTLDLAARLLRITGQLPALFTLLRTGFGVDLAAPDGALVHPAPSGSEEPAPPCAPTTHTLNTVLMALGEHATAPDMVVAYEVMAHPPPVPHARSAPVPNTMTYALLLKHLCTAPDTLFLSAALLQSKRSWLAPLARLTSREPSTPGLGTTKERDAEIQRRERGAYQALARFALDECLDAAAAQTARMGADLQQPRLGTLDLDAEACAELLAGKHAAADGSAPPRVADASAPGEAATTDVAHSGAPVFCPPSVSPTVETVYPLVSMASRRRMPMLLHWLQERLSRAYVLRDTERCYVHTALASVPAGAEAMRASLKAHLARTERDLGALAWLCLERIPSRIAALRIRNQERSVRRGAARAARAEASRGRRAWRRERREKGAETEAPAPAMALAE